MKQSRERGRVVSLADVIKSGSFLAPMAQWKPLAAAVSKPEFDAEMRRTEAWVLKLFRARGIKPGDYDALAVALARTTKLHGLKQKVGRSVLQAHLLSAPSIMEQAVGGRAQAKWAPAPEGLICDILKSAINMLRSCDVRGRGNIRSFQRLLGGSMKIAQTQLTTNAGAGADAAQIRSVRHLNQVELSRRWAISPRTLERWRWLGQGPSYIKIGGRVVYGLRAIEDFEAQQTRAGTAAVPVPEATS